MNHFNEFCEFVRGERWMSQAYRDILINKFMAAQSDAFERGKASVEAQADIPEFTLETLPKKYVTELRNILRGKIRGEEPFPGDPFINAIKRARELTNASLKDAKFWVERLRNEIIAKTPTGINTVTGKNRYGR